MVLTQSWPFPMLYIKIYFNIVYGLGSNSTQTTYTTDIISQEFAVAGDSSGEISERGLVMSFL